VLVAEITLATQIIISALCTFPPESWKFMYVAHITHDVLVSDTCNNKTKELVEASSHSGYKHCFMLANLV